MHSWRGGGEGGGGGGLQSPKKEEEEAEGLLEGSEAAACGHGSLAWGDPGDCTCY